VSYVGFHSLRSRITLGVVGITSAVVLISSSIAWVAVERFVFRGLDQELLGRSQRIPRLDGGPPPAWRQRDSRRWLQVVDLQSNELVRFLPDEVSLIGTVEMPNLPTTVSLPNGQRARVLLTLLSDGRVRAWHGVDLEPVDQELQRLASVLAVLWLAATLLAWLAVALLRSRLLSPLAQLNAAIERLGPEDLAARIPNTAGPPEVGVIVARINSLLDRLHEAFKREQTTIANIAHELRTPVAVLRTAIEFRQLAATDPAECKVLADCFRTVQRMQSVVSSLLLLAQLEAGKVALVREVVDLRAVLDDGLALWHDRAAARDQRFETDLIAEATLSTAPEHLQRVIDNLLGNAVAHAPDGATITVSLTASQLTVSNPCRAGIDSSQLGRIFYRADGARSDGDHVGLGLALCRRLLQLLGGRLELATEGDRFIARAWLTASLP
jgi:signal transduction histidine kinase